MSTKSREFRKGFREGFFFLVPFDRDMIKNPRSVGTGVGLVTYVFGLFGVVVGINLLIYRVF